MQSNKKLSSYRDTHEYNVRDSPEVVKVVADIWHFWLHHAKVVLLQKGVAHIDIESTQAVSL